MLTKYIRPRLLTALLVVAALPQVITLLTAALVNEPRQDVQWSLLMSIALTVIQGLLHIRAANDLLEALAWYRLMTHTMSEGDITRFAGVAIEPPLGRMCFLVKFTWAALLSGMAFTFVLQRPALLTLWLGPLMGVAATTTALYALYTCWWRAERRICR